MSSSLIAYDPKLYGTFLVRLSATATLTGGRRLSKLDQDPHQRGVSSQHQPNG